MLKKGCILWGTALAGFAAAIAFLVWFKNVPGVPGLLEWHSDIKMITGAFTVMLFVIPVFLVLALFFLNRKKLCSRIFSSVSIFISAVTFIGGCGLIIFCVSTGNRMTKNYTKMENLLVQSDIKKLERVAFSSDPHWNNEDSNKTERSKIINLVGKGNYDAFFCLGDISDWGDTKDGYEEPVKELNAGLAGTPFFSVMGNHDALISAYPIFNKIFYGVKNAPRYFRMDYDDVHFLVLDLLWGDEEFGKKEKAWLIEQLEEIPEEEKVIVISHGFYISSGYTDTNYNKNWYDIPSMIENLCPIFEKYNVDLVISGHNHLMELLEKNGVTYVVIGSMGGILDSLEYKSPYSVWLNNRAFGYMDMNLSTEGKIDFTFLDSDGNFLYSYEVQTE